MKDKELFELGKSVFRKTEWGNTERSWQDTGTEQFEHYEDVGEAFNRRKVGSTGWPIYTSDYLLEKLPKRIHLSLDLMDRETVLDAYWGQEDIFNKITADTPLKALLKLTLALNEAGLLTNKVHGGDE